VDFPERAARFEVVYHFLSPRWNNRIRIKVRHAQRHDDDHNDVQGTTAVYLVAESSWQHAVLQ
jgi:NADH:ubiquinone oxidoreductase subunit C